MSLNAEVCILYRSRQSRQYNWSYISCYLKWRRLYPSTSMCPYDQETIFAFLMVFLKGINLEDEAARLFYQSKPFIYENNGPPVSANCMIFLRAPSCRMAWSPWSWLMSRAEWEIQQSVFFWSCVPLIPVAVRYRGSLDTPLLCFSLLRVTRGQDPQFWSHSGVLQTPPMLWLKNTAGLSGTEHYRRFKTRVVFLVV